MFFSKKKKGNVVEILAPVDGDAVPLEDVRDQVIAQGLMGEGIAIDPINETVFAPCEGEITHISEQEHVIGMRCENGSNILIHVGINTGELHGEGFEILTRVNDYVYACTPLLSFDLDYIKEKGLCPYVITVSPKNESYDVSIELDHGEVQANESVIFTIDEA